LHIIIAEPTAPPEFRSRGPVDQLHRSTRDFPPYRQRAISSAHMLTGASEAALVGHQVGAIRLAGSSAKRSARVVELAEAGPFEGLLSPPPVSGSRQQIASRVPSSLALNAERLADVLSSIGHPLATIGPWRRTKLGPLPSEWLALRPTSISKTPPNTFPGNSI
jgi:hypothetical protein